MSYKNGIGLSVCVNGRPTKEYTRNGNSFIEARNGTNYTIKIKNDNAYKVMAVLSVDGLDVITGKAAEESNKGYILDAYSNVEIKGYRISDQNSAAFVFTSKGKSYVQNATSDARNSGVIGVRVFKEKYKAPVPQSPTVIHHYHPQPYYVYPWNPYPTYPNIVYGITTTGVAPLSYTTTIGQGSINVNSVGTASDAISHTCNADMSNCTLTNATLNANMSKGASKGAGGQSCGGVLRSMAVANNFDAPISYKQFDTGTGWGKKLDDKVRKEYFDKGDLLTEIVTYYASKTALVDMGLDLDEDPRVSEEPQMPKAFKSKYCEPPKGWVG